jgi:hypothetical protein
MAVRTKRTKKPRRKPQWLGRTLWWGDNVAKGYTREAPGQMAVLDLFESLGWPSRVDASTVVPPEVNGKCWIRNTVTNLNRRLRRIRFHADGPNHCIKWALP